MPEITVRRTAADDLRAASDVVRVALLMSPSTDEDWEKVKDSWVDQLSLSALDGEDCIGHTGAFRFDTVVPGGAWLPTAGVSRVGVLPTHRRRGVLTSLMSQLLDDAREAGNVLASLRASEATIYERFGFGLAGDAVRASVDTQRARPLRAAAAGGTFRLLTPAELMKVVPDLYERAAHRAGEITRPAWTWHRYLEEALDAKEGNFVVVHSAADGTDDGYAHYSVKWSEKTEEHMTGQGEVIEIRGRDAGVELALWQYLLDVDLVRRYGVDECAVDDVIFGAAADRRAVKVQARYDEQWLRLLDVGTALAKRSFAPSEAVAVAVTDDRFDDNSGTWEIGPDGSSPTGRAPDLVTSVAGLSAAYLGSTSWSDLVATGRATATGPSAIGKADALFAVRPLAFCGSFF